MTLTSVGKRRTVDMTIKLLLCLLWALYSVHCGHHSVSVRLIGGEVKGKTEQFEDKSLNVFLGIPYAQPPVDGLRFKKPLPIESWSEPIEAYNCPKPCFQMHPFPEKFRNQEMSEDQRCQIYSL